MSNRNQPNGGASCQFRQRRTAHATAAALLILIFARVDKVAARTVLPFLNSPALAPWSDTPALEEEGRDDTTFAAEQSRIQIGGNKPLAFNTLFWHNVEIFNWLNQINYQNRIHRDWEVTAFVDLNSILQQQSNADVWKDDQRASLAVKRTLAGFWRLHAGASMRFFQDDFGSGNLDARNNDFTLHRFELLNELRLRPNLKVSPGLGVKWENILGRQDNGPRAEIGVTLTPSIWQDYVHQFDAEARLEKTPDRQNDDLNFTYGVSRDFSGQASDSLYLRINHLRRDNYFSNIDTLYVDSVNRNRRSLENRLNYRIDSNWQFRLHSMLSESVVDIRRRLIAPAAIADDDVVGRLQHIDFEARHLAQLLQQSGDLLNEIFLDYGSLSRKYQNLLGSALFRRYPSEGYDSDEWELALGHRLRWQLTGKGFLRWYGTIKRRAYNTANLENPNDHDRLQFQASLLYQHRFNPFLTMIWEARTFLEHQVYLKGNLSGDNRWSRIWQLLPALQMKLAPGVMLKQGFGVRATFFDYDFPVSISNRRSIVLRDFFVTDSLAVTISERTMLNLQYKLTLEERGLLDWERWLQSPQTEIHRHTLFITFEQQLSKYFLFTPGVGYFVEKNWRFENRPRAGLVKIFIQEQAIVTPMLQIRYVRGNTVVLFEGRRQMSFLRLPRNVNRRGSNVDTFNLTIQWAI